ncbi:hypothetical protein C1H76_8776 [Elsinoe australis]|uniref:ER-bound oxygenase mpaB/mpaB'/Rubber oxygenase catalytic domain-containing protein n=1 Tax=Elsinoe australis TaxID=40998 RepID=A0A4U7AV15_9PEZI|nr:hypothetical protein C1H76_8776 [Elsinoe australis]
MDYVYPAVGLTMVYLYVVHVLRFRWVDNLSRRYNVVDRTSLGKLSLGDAFCIVREMIELEFPHMMGLSIGFALFKTYGIPEISSLLVSTGQLKRPETISKRVADTGTLILEFVLNEPRSQRRQEAIARMNWLHSRYEKSGKIRNDALLYTLSLFALEPLRWIPKYEWRDLTDVERCAHGMVWKSIGDAMKIQYLPLASSTKQPEHPQAGSWMDRLQWLEELSEWSEQYEAQHQRFAESNKRLSYANIDLLLNNIPLDCFKNAGRLFYSSLLEDHLRAAIQFPEPSAANKRIVKGILALRAFLICHFFLPRYDSFFRRDWIVRKTDSRPDRINMIEYITFPWYVKPSVWNRWGPYAWMTWFAGGAVPGDDVRYKPEGFKTFEVGPEALEGKGQDEMMADLDDIRRRAERIAIPTS